MIPLLFEKDSREFKHLGLGALPSWIEDTIEVVEERNGEFYLQGELPVGALHVDQLAYERIILAAPAPGMPAQPFRIQPFSKPPESDTIKIVAKHVSYQLTKHIAKPNNFATASAQEAMSWAFDSGHMVPQLDGKFTFESDITLLNLVQYKHMEPLNVRAALGGVKDSMTDLFGGELEWDRWTVRLLKSRGRDNGKIIRYAQNLDTLSFDIDDSDLVTGYYGWWRNSETGAFNDAIVYKSNVNDFAYARVQPVDLSGKVDFDEETQLTPTDAEMLSALQDYVDAQDSNHLRTCINVTAVPDDLQDVHLCDTVTAIHPGYDLQQKAKVVRTVFDPIKERYKEVTIGELQRTITDTIAGLLRGVK